MRFSKFISEQLDRQRGLQSRLAKKLCVSRSTITAWRRGARPDFRICLLLADHFRLNPLKLFEMVEAPSYRDAYRRFFRGPAAAGKMAAEAARDAAPAPRWEPLTANPRHAEIHRDLQELLDADNPESRAVVTVIRMGVRQLRESKRADKDASSRRVKKAG